MRVSSETSDDISVSDGEGVHPLVGVLLEQGQRRLLNLDILTMHHGDEHEVTPALIGMVEMAALATKGRNSEGLGITSEGLRRLSMDVARELVEYQNQRQAPGLALCPSI